MRTSSIFENLDKNALLAELSLQLGNPINQNKVFVLFEGKDDISFFQKFLSDDCYAFESYGGKDDIVFVLSLPGFSSDNRIIGIVDKDYFYPSYPKLFYCDYCNCEMMVASNNDVFNDVVNSLAKKKGDHSTARNEYLKILAPLSVIRKRNSDSHLGIDICNINLKYHIKSNLVSFTDFIDKINNLTLNADYSANKSIYESELNNVILNPLDYTNGHDFCSALDAAINKFLLFGRAKNRTFSEDDIRCRFYLRYSPDDFKHTSLYKDLELYELVNSFNILK